jgi:hypothetical protein
MNLTVVLEVAIGIVFIWMTLSIATMQIQEWVITWTKKRSKDLEAAIRKMLAEPASGEFFERFKLADYFYDHPIIRGLTAEKGKKPSYIPARQFATVLFDIAMTAGTEASYIQQGLYSLRQDLKKVDDKNDREVFQNNLEALIETARTIASSKAGSEATEKLLKKLKMDIHNFSISEGKNKYPELVKAANTVLEQADKLYKDFLAQNPPHPQNNEAALDQIRKGLVALSAISPEASRTMETLLQNVEEYATATEKEIAIARSNVENWFDSSMDRLSGVFKRYAQWWALLIGFILALTLNVDSIALTKHLWVEPTTRQVLVANSAEFEFDKNIAAEDPDKAMQEFNKNLSGLNLPVGWSVKKIENANNCTFWPTTNDQYFGIRWFGNNQCLNPSAPDNSTNFAVKLAGILISALATMQGAPYWFDILKKLVNVRGTGKKPEEK